MAKLEYTDINPTIEIEHDAGGIYSPDSDDLQRLMLYANKVNSLAPLTSWTVTKQNSTDWEYKLTTKAGRTWTQDMRLTDDYHRQKVTTGAHFWETSPKAEIAAHTQLRDETEKFVLKWAVNSIEILWG